MLKTVVDIFLNEGVQKKGNNAVRHGRVIVVSAFLAGSVRSVGLARASNKCRGELGSASLLLLPIWTQFIVLGFIS